MKIFHNFDLYSHTHYYVAFLRKIGNIPILPDTVLKLQSKENSCYSVKSKFKEKDDSLNG